MGWAAPITGAPARQGLSAAGAGRGAGPAAAVRAVRGGARIPFAAAAAAADTRLQVRRCAAQLH